MSAKKNSNVPPEFINELLYVNFQSMQVGSHCYVNKPQLLQFFVLYESVSFLSFPDDSAYLFSEAGGSSSKTISSDPVIRPLLTAFPSKIKYEWKQHLEAWKYGSGLDYKL
ncbi:unnamed protein product [Dovyalis caffra]|uniref:Uncharacterized protein n=1 Tax=Dovyalis caffra TaxID=77055 RepID=A0AAV1SF29_9ROSI|nr:unnamed protein product [Dovyalis caffra]